MFPSFGTEYSPGDLLSTKTFQKVASLVVETESDEKFKFFFQHAIIDSSKALSNLCSMLDCNGQYMAKTIFGAQERFETLLNFLYSQRNYFACVGSYIIQREDENCFQITAFQNSPADLMISKTVSGTFFLCVLTSKFPIKNIVVLMQEFEFLLQKASDISSEIYQYFDDQSVEVTVFANWNDMLFDQKPVKVAIEKMLAYIKENEPKVIGFEVEDLAERLPDRPPPLDPTFEKCYRLMRSMKLKGSELPKINDSKKKKNDSVTFHRLKSSLEDLENELKHSYFLKFETIEHFVSVFPDALNHVETNLQSYTASDVALDLSFYETLESCLTLLLTKYSGGDCDIRNSSVFYNAEDMEDAQKIFGNKAFIALKSPSFEFKKWLDLKFLQLYPLCYVRKFPSISESLFLCDNGTGYGFGVVTLKKPNWKKNADKVAKETFTCVNPEHKHPRYWKCNACNLFVSSNGKEISCKKCGTSSFENVEFRCALSDLKICTKKAIASSRAAEKVNKKVDVSNTEAKNVYNIVLFGPVASGKSTLINAVMNYCEYPSYENASSRSLVAPIPYKFSFFDSSFQEKIVQSKEIPDNSSENFESKSHITQKPKVYEKYYNGKTFKFLDTIGYGAAKEFSLMSNLALWRTFKHIDAVWITFSATQDLGDIDAWILQIIKPIPKKLFSRIYFLFTNVHGKHALRFNLNVKIVAQCVSKFNIPFGGNNVFAVENNCLKSLYAQGAGCSLIDVQDSLNVAWTGSRGVILDLLDKASASKSHDEDVYFLINLFFLYFRLKRLVGAEKLRETGCAALLEQNFLSSSEFVNDKSPSYADIYNALVKLESKIPVDCQQRSLFVEFIKTFEDFAKKQHYGAYDMVADIGKRLLSYMR